MVRQLLDEFIENIDAPFFTRQEEPGCIQKE
jgi:hypothetical protein